VSTASTAHADTTVIAANVACPTDSGLLAKAVGKLVRTARRVQAAGGATGTVMTDRRRRVREIAGKQRRPAAGPVRPDRPGRDHLPGLPGERLVACMNPFLEAERARKRESLLAATDADLGKIAVACARVRRPLRGKDKITVRSDRVLKRRKVARHFTVEITHSSTRNARDQDSIATEAWLDGINVLRTSVGPAHLDSGEVVSSYKALAQVERAFRTDLDIRPIRHRTEGRVRAHVFLRMLSCYISWHPQTRLASLLFSDDDKPAVSAARPSRSPLPSDLGTICLNTIALANPALPGFRLVTTPTALQPRAFDLLGVSHRLGAP
jgi:hypothetical protein